MRATKAVDTRSHAGHGFRLRLGVTLLLLAGFVGGCKVQSEDIEYWKRTVKGPGKIVAVMLADKYPMELRIQAALALVEMERQDLDGTAELQKALQRLDDQTRGELIAGMVTGLTEMMNTAAPKANEGPDLKQIRAKDASFLLITHATPDVRKQLTEAVVKWYIADFNGRSLAGNYSAEQVVRALGSPAARALVGGLDAKLPQQALVKMAQLIGQLGDSTAKEEAGKRLVAIEIEMESPAFVKWLGDGVSEQLSTEGKKADPKRVKAIAELNRENFIIDGALSAMKWLADQKVIKQRLITLASNRGTNRVWTERRRRALQALEGKVARSDLPAIMAIATDANVPGAVRDYAFDRIGDIRSPEALPSLWPLVEDAGDQRLRWRAGELVLAIGGAGVLDDFFTKLPPETAYAAEEVEGYATRMGQMTPLPSVQVRAQLASQQWHNRLIALKFFERKGSADDVRRMSALRGDSAKITGPRWGDAKTVGAVAKGSVQAAKARLGGKAGGK